MTVTIADVRKAACLYYGILPSVLSAPDRHRDIARPRQVAMKVCRDLTRKSLPAIAAKFGNLDHTTVMYAITAVPEIAKGCEKTANALHAVPELAARISADRMAKERVWVDRLLAGEVCWLVNAAGNILANG